MNHEEERSLNFAPADCGSGSGTARAACDSDNPANEVSWEQLRDLVRELTNEEDEEDRPSRYSVDAFEQLISETCKRLGGVIPRPAVIPDERGIRIAWKSNDQEVRVVLPESQGRRAYIYFKKGSHSELDETLSANLLAQRLEAIG